MIRPGAKEGDGVQLLEGRNFFGRSQINAFAHDANFMTIPIIFQ